MEEEYDDYTFTVYEVDLDYEFDASRFFDFSRAESPLEVRLAEVWFCSAGSYPDSPFVSRLVPREEEILMGNVNIYPKSKGVDDLLENFDIETNEEISVVGMNYRGLNFAANNVNSKPQHKFSMKPSFSRTSTLMKPTVSQLAKQRHRLEGGYSRSQRSFFEKTNKNSSNPCETQNQDAKRQKLDGGLLRKDGLLVGSTPHTIPRVTTPREPELKTADRAQRIRQKGIKEPDNVASVVRRFKALPLNRKILEAPPVFAKRSTPHLPDFQEFHLKTSERAMQNHSAVPKSTVRCDNNDKVTKRHLEYGICFNNFRGSDHFK